MEFAGLGGVLILGHHLVKKCRPCRGSQPLVLAKCSVLLSQMPDGPHIQLDVLVCSRWVFNNCFTNQHYPKPVCLNFERERLRSRDWKVSQGYHCLGSSSPCPVGSCKAAVKRWCPPPFVPCSRRFEVSTICFAGGEVIHSRFL